ncbi:MAG: ATP-dependent endonuclease [Pirellulales bacterium]
MTAIETVAESDSTPFVSPRMRCRLLLVVEGVNDIEFLRRISLHLHAVDSSLPHLADMERTGELIFVPFGGGDVRAWTHRLAPLNRFELHLYDHELPPETEYRHQAAAAVNQRDNCRAVVTRKRSLENYLHPWAIRAAGGPHVRFGDFDSVAELTAKQRYQRQLPDTAWELLTRRARSRMTQRAKRWLNTRAADQMTAELLKGRDPKGEILSWLATIGRLINPR